MQEYDLTQECDDDTAGQGARTRARTVRSELMGGTSAAGVPAAGAPAASAAASGAWGFRIR